MGVVSSTAGPSTGPLPLLADPGAVAAPEPVGADVRAGHGPVREAGGAAVPPRGRGLRGTAFDMVASTVVVVALVALLVALVPRPNAVPIHEVDVAAAAQRAGRELGFDPALPQGLPAGWVATSADVRHSADGVTTWHVGYVTPSGNYASIEQAAWVTKQWEDIMDSGGTPRRPEVVTVDGTLWEQRYKDVRDVTALIHRGKSRTTMVTSKIDGLAGAEVLARSIPASQR